MSGTARTSAGRGRPPRISRALVVSEAVTLADSDGLAAVSMRALAVRLGVAPMSLYTHVADKRGLVEAMVALAVAEQRFPPPTGDWRADLHVLAGQQREMLRRHPWVADALAHVRPLIPEFLPSYELGLAALEPLALPPSTAMETLALLTGVVVSLVRAELVQQLGPRRLDAGPEAERDADQQAPAGAPRAPDEALERALTSGHYPRLAAALAAQRPGPPVDLPRQFDRILDRYLDGLVPQGRTELRDTD